MTMAMMATQGSMPVGGIPKGALNRMFWTKRVDGGVLVTLHRGGGRAISVEVLDPATKAVQHFGSLRQFWRALGRSPVSIKRYTNREGRRLRDGTLLELLNDSVAVPKLGIDLTARGHEVRKLMWAGFGHKILRAGYDPEDVLQEVFRGLIARNAGQCPWDVRKSSFGHYVHMVIGCVLINYHRKQQQVRGTEVLGMRGPDGEYGDASGQAVEPEVVVHEDTGLQSGLLAGLPEELRGAGSVVMGILADGGTYREAQRAAGLKADVFETLLECLRSGALR